jgi:outer membrane protein assembly factor BamB
MDKMAMEQFIAELKALYQSILPTLSEEQAKAAEEELKNLLQPFNSDKPFGVWVTDDDLKTDLTMGDLILEVDGTSLRDFGQFAALLRRGEHPTSRTLKILRRGEEKNITVEEIDESLYCWPSTLVIQGDTLYTGIDGMDGGIYALKATTGEILWEFHVPTGIDWLALEGKCLIADSSYWIKHFFNTIYVLGTERGELLWKTRGNSDFENHPLLAGEMVYMMDWQGLSIRQKETGAVIWQAKHDLRTSPELKAVAETTVYLSTYNWDTPRSSARLYALDTQTGEEFWQFPITIVKDVLVGEGETVYFTTSDQLYALNPKPKGTLPQQEEHESLLGIGTALVALGRYEEAIPKLKEALELRSDLTEAVWQLMLAYEGMEQWDKAAKERNEYLLSTRYHSAPPEVKKHLWERFGILKWASPGEPDFVIRRHVPADAFEKAPAMGAMPQGLRWGGVMVPTIMEGKIHWESRSGPISPEEWVDVEALGREGVNYLRQQERSDSLYQPYEPQRSFRDGERIYIECIRASETTSSEGTPEYRLTSFLEAFSEATGDLLWKFETDRGTRPTKQVFDSVLLVSDLVPPLKKEGGRGDLGGIYWGVEGRLYALNKETGALGWEFHDEAATQLFTHGGYFEVRGDTMSTGGGGYSSGG